MPTIALAVAALGCSSCASLDKVRGAVHDVRGNKATIDSFDSKLQSGAATPFEATYVTTGVTAATVVYGVQPPTGVAFDLTPTGGTDLTSPVHLVVNSAGEFACSQVSPSASSASAGWTCDKLGTADAATQSKLFDFYAPSHWVSFSVTSHSPPAWRATRSARRP